MSGRIIRLVAACLILAAAFLLFQQKQKKAEFAADYGICDSPRPDPLDAIQACDRLIHNWPMSDDLLSLTYRNRSRANLALKKLPDALEDAQSAISAYPDGATSWALKSHVFVQMKDYSAARAAIDTALERSPEDDYSQRMKLELLIHGNEISNAYHFIDELKKRHPDRFWIYRQSGRLQLRENNYAAAAESFAKSLELKISDKYSYRKFFKACRSAGTECPLLFSDIQRQSAELSCDEVFPYLTTIFPDWESQRALGNGYADLQQYLYGTPPLQSGVYFAFYRAMTDLEKNTKESDAERFIGLDGAMACIHEAQIGRAKNALELEVEQGIERVFPSQIRQNLMQKAHMVLAQ
ncbi:putative PEP-CTERM system TPR-repeat lipoprotein [Ruegeria denitrificans]|uniref:Putative PEP-CTERM system TPR-repeat lipoprotein n=1 Tax=Ruegeria denitrificans TaxID=1715692 RepID=A0A0P1IDQ9_9RHOB|nr:tetratricopeptide repeat protein [Ruegeria denitrificans]CUK07072.1 putative PEP-CTERM system TPR-repeat lipoprotein [Ruegeria denitrificans]